MFFGIFEVIRVSPLISPTRWPTTSNRRGILQGIHPIPKPDVDIRWLPGLMEDMSIGQIITHLHSDSRNIGCMKRWHVISFRHTWQLWDLMSNLRLDGMQFGRRRSLYLPWLYHNKLEGDQLVKGFWVLGMGSPEPQRRPFLGSRWPMIPGCI